MRARRLLLVLSILIFTIASAPAATIRVSPNGTLDFATIADAYGAASDGDTLVLSSGDYGESITSTKRLTVIGAGWDEVSTNSWYFNSGSDGSLIEGVRLSTSGAVRAIYAYAGVDSLTIRRCYLQQNTTGACFERQNGPGGDWITFEDCVFDQNYPVNGNLGMRFNGDSCSVRNCVFESRPVNTTALYGDPLFLTVVNSVFLNWTHMFNLTGEFGFYYANNIMYDWTGAGDWGTYPASGTIDYNASEVAPPGTNAITLAGDPFVNYDETNGYEDGISDLHLDPTNGAVLIDGGLPTLLDRDASRSDLGVYGGPIPLVAGGAPDFPFVTDLTIPAAIITGDSLSVNSTGRIGPRYQ